MLCFRCEHRATYLETGAGPRCECKDPLSSVHSCYMFIPCAPVITEKTNPDDPREEHGGYFGCRMTGVEIAKDCTLKTSKTGYLYWNPKKKGVNHG